MKKFKFIFCVILTININLLYALLPEKVQCANKDCTEKISTVTATITYNAVDEGMLSYKGGSILTIFSKSDELWGAELNGKRGFVNKRFMRENRIFTSKLEETQVPFKYDSPKIEPHKPIIVSGTTVYLDDNENLTESIENTTPVPREIKDSATDVPKPTEQTNSKEDTSSENAIKSEPSLEEEEIPADPASQGIKGAIKNVWNTVYNKFHEKYDENDDDYVDGEDDEDEDDDGEEDEDTEEESIEIKGNDAKNDEEIGSMELSKEEHVSKLPEIQKSNEKSEENVMNVIETTQTKEENVHKVEENVKMDEYKENLIINSHNSKDNVQKIDANVMKVEQNAQNIEGNLGNELKLENTTQNEEEVLHKIEEHPQKVIENVQNIEEVAPVIENIQNLDDNIIKSQENVEKLQADEENVNIHAKNVKTDESHIKIDENNVKTDENTAKIIDEKTITTDSIKTEENSIKTDQLNDNFTFSPDNINIKLSENELNNVASNEIETNPVELKEDEKLVAEIIPPKIQELTTEPHQAEDKPSNFLTYPPASQFHYHTPHIDNNASPEVAQEHNEYATPSPLMQEEKQDKNDYYQPETTTPELPLETASTETAPANLNNITPIQSDAMETVYQQEEPLIDTETVNQDGNVDENSNEETTGFLSNVFSYFSSANENVDVVTEAPPINAGYSENYNDMLISKQHECESSHGHCSISDNPTINSNEVTDDSKVDSIFNFELTDLVVFLSITAVSIVIFLWGYMIIDKMRKEGPLILKINNLEKALLVANKQVQMISDEIQEVQSHDQVDIALNSDLVRNLRDELEESNNARVLLEEQIQSLEKELENSAEVGLELNRMLSDVLNSQNGSDTVMANIEQLQKQLVEQQATLNTVNAKLNEKDTENYELNLELEIRNKKVLDLQAELDKMVLNLIKIEEERDYAQNKYETEISQLKDEYSKLKMSYNTDKNKYAHELSDIRRNYDEIKKNYDIKTNEYNLLKDIVNQKNNIEDFKAFLDANAMKAEMQHLQDDNLRLKETLGQNQHLISEFEKQISNNGNEISELQSKYDKADKEKLEALTKLDVLSVYFKQREEDLQKELSKHEKLWSDKQGEATSTTERIKFQHEEIENFKAQIAKFQQEILSQEVELKSQISVLEKKSHDNWLTARQAERKNEELRQEASQLRNRLTLRERNLNDAQLQNRMQSPLEANGDHTLSPLHMNVDSPVSPSLLYGAREHMTTSPALPGLPPFMAHHHPPPGVPFMPPPLPGIPPFLPPPPSMYPGDHRPPPLGRMSSPPINSRYSSDSRPYSPYDRRTPSPTDDEYYEDHHHSRGFNPYNGRDNRDLDRRLYAHGLPPPPQMRNNSRGGTISSGSAHSNDSLEKLNRQNSKV